MNNDPEKCWWCGQCNTYHWGDCPKASFPYQAARRWAVALCVVVMLLAGLLLSPLRSQGAGMVPPTATIGEPVMYPMVVYLPLVVREGR